MADSFLKCSICKKAVENIDEMDFSTATWIFCPDCIQKHGSASACADYCKSKRIKVQNKI
jgi:hypothetical protein